MAYPPRCRCSLDGRNSNTAMIALNYARNIVNNFNDSWQRDHGLPKPPATLVTHAWFNANLESRLFIVPGVIGVLLLVVVIMSTAMSVAREREQGTFDQLLVTPLRPLEILIGKSMPGLIIGLFEATVVIGAAVWWFEVPLRGHLATLYFGILLFLLSAIGVGLMISSLAATLQQALLGGFMFLVPAVILSGFATPIGNMPQVVQYITLFNPLRYFMVVLRSVFLEGTPFALLVESILADGADRRLHAGVRRMAVPAPHVLSLEAPAPLRWRRILRSMEPLSGTPRLEIEAAMLLRARNAPPGTAGCTVRARA